MIELNECICCKLHKQITNKLTDTVQSAKELVMSVTNITKHERLVGRKQNNVSYLL